MSMKQAKSNPLSIWAIDKEGTITLASGKAIELLGHDPKKMIGQSIYELLPDAESLIHQCLEGSEFTTETDVSGCIWETSYMPMRNKQGAIIGAIGSSIDITQSQKTETALQESREKLLQSQYIARMGDFTVDLETDDIVWSEGMYRLLGYDPHEKINFEWASTEILYSEDLTNFRDWLQACIVSGQEKHEPNEYRFHRKNGEVFWGQVSFVVKYRGGKPVKLTGTCLDVDALKKAEELVQESETHYHNFFDNALVGLFRSRISDGILTEANALAASMLGYTPDELLGKVSTLDLYQNPDDRKELLTGLKSKGEFHGFETELKRKDGSSIFVSISVRADLEKDYLEGALVDITERHQAEEALRRYEKIVSSSTDLMALLDMNYIYQAVNDEYCRAFGKTKDEIVGHTISEIFGKQFFLETIRPNADKALGGEEAHYEAWYEFPGWGKRCMEVNYYPYFDKDGKVSGFVVNRRDITERKFTEAALRDSEERMDLTIKGANLGTWDWDIASGYVTFNEQWTEMLGYSLDEIVPNEKSWEKLVHPDDLPEVMTILQEHLEGKTEFYKTTHRMRHKSGEWIWVLDSGRVIHRDSEDRPVRACGIHLDITDRRRALEELKREKAFADAIIDSVTGIFYVLDHNGGFVRWNRRFAELLGVSNEELPDRFPNAVSVIHEDDREYISKKIQNVFKEGYDEADARLIPEAGGWDFYFSGVRMDIDGGPYLVGIGLDVTERKRAEQTIRKERDTAQRYFDIAGVIMIALDREGNITAMNRKGCEVCGYKEEEIVGKNWFDHCIASQKTEQVKATFKKLISGEIEPVKFFENEIITSDGTKRLIAWHNSIVYDENGQIAGTFSSGEDITDRRRAERQLKRIFDNTQDAIFIHDLDGRILDVNEKMCRMYNVTKEEASTLTIEEVSSSRMSMEDVANIWKQVLAGSHELFDWEAKKPHDGTVFDVEVSLQKIDYYDREVILANVRDITDRKRAEAALQAKAEELNTYFASSLDLLCIANTNGTFVRLNPEWERTLGYSPAELEGKSFLDLVHPDDLENTVQAVSTLEAQEEIFRFTNRYRRKDGSYRWIEWNSKPQGETIYAVARDITDRKQVEKELEKASRDWQTTFDAVNDAIWLLDNQSRIVKSNRATKTLLGKNPDAVNGMHCWEVVHGTSSPIPECPVLKMKKSLQRESMELEIGNRMVQVVVDPVFNEEGTLTGCVHIVNDITERKLAEEALKESEERLAEAQRIAGLGGWIVSLDGRLTWTDITYEIYGQDPATFKPTTDSFLNSIHPDDREIVRNWIEEANASGEGKYHEFRITKPDGTIAYLSGRGKIVYDSMGKPLHFAGTVMDITERKLAELALRESEERFRNLVDTMAEGTGIVDENEIFTFANPAGDEIFGFKKGGLAGHSLVEFLDSGQLEKVKAETAKRREGTSSTYELEIIRHDGERRYLVVSATPLMDDSGKTIGTTAVFHDITEQRLAETALRESESKLREAQKLAKLGHWYWDIGTGEVEWSDEVFNIFRLNPKEFKPQIDSIMELSPWPEDHQRHTEIMQKALESRESGKFEQRFMRPDGSTGYYFSTFQGIYDESDTLCAMRGTVQDITQRKLAENALRESEEKYRLIVENQNDLIIKADANGRFTFVSPSFCRIFGKSEEELIDHQFLPLVHPDDRTKTSELISRLSSPPYTTYVEHRTKTAKGWRWLSWVTTSIIDDQGNLSEFIGVGRDITDRKQAEQALAISEEKFRNIVESSPMGMHMYELNSAGELVFVGANPAADKILGVDNSQFLGRSILEVVPNFTGTELLERFKRAAKDGTPWATQQVLYEDDKSTGAFEVYAFQTKPGSMTAMFLDITERVKAEQALKDSEEKLRNIFENSTNMFYSHTTEHVLTYSSPQVEKMLGYTPKEAMRRWTELATDNPINENGFAKTVEAIETGEAQPPYELELRHKSGHKVWVEVREAPVVEDGKTTAIVGALTDITDRKRAEERLRKSELKHRLFLENFEGIAYQTEFKTFSPTFFYGTVKEITGYPPEAFLTSQVRWDQLIHPDDAEEVKRVADELKSRSDYIADSEYRIYDKKGEVRWVRDIARSVEIENGKSRIIQGAIYDVTRRKLALEKLRDSEYQLRESQRVSRIGSYLMDITKGIWHSSDTLNEIFGIDDQFPKTVEGWLSVVHPDDLQEMQVYLLDEVIGKHKYFDKEYRIVRHDDQEVRWVHGRGELRLNNEGKPIQMVGTILDTTERKNAEEKLRRSENNLRTTLNSIGDAVIATDTHGMITRMNPVAEDLTGWSLEEAFGQPLSKIFNIVHAQTRKEVENPVTKILKTNKIIGLANHTVLISRDGNEYQIADSGAPIIDPDGKTHGVVMVFRDVTEDYEIRDRIAENEQRLKSIFRVAPTGIGVVRDRVFADVNDLVCRMVGRTREELIGTSVRIVYSTQEEFERVGNEKYDQISKHGTGTIETQWQHKDGKILDILLSSTPIDPKDLSKGVTFTALDITESKQNQAAIRENERMMSTLLSNLPGMVYRCENDRDWTMDFISQGCKDLTGYPPESFLHNEKLSFNDIISLEFQHPVWDEVQRALAEKRSYRLEYPIHTKEGKIKWVTDLACGVFDGDDLLSIEGFIMDITEQREAEKLLRVSEDRFRTLYDSSLDGVLLLKDGAFVDCNQKAADMFKWPKDDIVGKHPAFLSPPTQPGGKDSYKYADEIIQQALQTGTNSFEWLHQRSDGEIFNCEIRLKSVQLQDGPYLMTIIRDISDQKRIQREREALNQQLAESNRRLAMMSRKILENQEQDRRRIARELHDEIGQLLTAMKINLQFLVKEADCGEKDDVICERLEEQLELTNTTIQQVRTISLDLRPSMLDDLGLIPAIRWYLDHQSQRSKIQISVEESGIPKTIDPAIENACYRVLQEAVNNILKHAEATVIYVGVETVSDELHLVIRDNGKGFNVEEARTRAVQGKSFGLLGMQERLELINGSFTIDSEYGKGSEIKAIFPLSISDTNPNGN